MNDNDKRDWFSHDAIEESLLEAIERLPEEQGSALRMRYVEKLTTKEIAAKLGKSDAAVRVMLTRSRKRLQDILRNVKQG